MKMYIHREKDRGRAEHGWLHSKFSFSFADWYDPDRMGFGALRVINDDIVEPQSGFGMHPHQNMEIITIVKKGTVTHRDTMGNETEVRSGEVQIMSAGTGILHSEMNASLDTPLELFQIWIEPNIYQSAPRYQQQAFKQERPPGTLELLVGNNLEEESALSMQQDAFLFRAVVDEHHSIRYELQKPGHGIYFFVISGCMSLFGTLFSSRDGVGVTDVLSVDIAAKEFSEILIFEVPMV